MYNLESFGSFFIGGRKVQIQNEACYTTKRSEASPEISINPNGEFLIESTYVQFFIPSPTNGVPLLLIHGGGNTGAVWENTPDRRLGWLHYFLQKNRSCYVIDSVERGRAGWCNQGKLWPGIPERKSLECIWSAARIGTADHYEKRIPFANSQFPTEHFETLSQHDVPRWNCNQTPSKNGIIHLIKKIGPATLIQHSQSSEFTLQAAAEYIETVCSLVLVEPASFPRHFDFSRFKGKRVLFIYGDNLTGNAFWDPLCVQAKAFAQELKMHCHVDWFDLPSMGITGNSHYLMLDKNNLEIVELIHSWLQHS